MLTPSRHPCLCRRLLCWHRVISLATSDRQMWGSIRVTMYEGSGLQAHTQEMSPDPRLWSRSHVTLWLQHAAVQYQLGNTYPEKFPMNGKGLLLMTKDMFLYRVPQGGGILYEDLQFKLQKACEVFERAAKEALANVTNQSS